MFGNATVTTIKAAHDKNIQYRACMQWIELKSKDEITKFGGL